MKKEDWISIEDRMPLKPKTPYHSYLVWLRGVQGKIEDGIFVVAQYSRELEIFIPEQLLGLVLTHWAEVPNPITGEF